MKFPIRKEVLHKISTKKIKKEIVSDDEILVLENISFIIHLLN
jgi:hypothetical protein